MCICIYMCIYKCILSMIEIDINIMYIYIMYYNVISCYIVVLKVAVSRPYIYGEVLVRLLHRSSKLFVYLGHAGNSDTPRDTSPRKKKKRTVGLRIFKFVPHAILSFRQATSLQ